MSSPDQSGQLDGGASRGHDRPARLVNSTLLAVLRHEINNPLAIIMGHAQLLDAAVGPGADPAVKVSIRRITESVHRISEVLRSLEPGDDAGPDRSIS